MLHAVTRHAFRFAPSRCHLPLYTAVRWRGCRGSGVSQRNPVVVQVVPFLSSARDGSHFEEYCFQCLVLHKPFLACGDILEAYSNAIQAANTVFGDQDSDLDDAVQEAHIELANEVPVAESHRVVLPVSDPFDTGPLVAPPVSVSVAPSLLLTIMIGPRLVNISASLLPTQINLSGSAAKIPRRLPVQARPILRCSTKNSVRFSTQSLLTTLRGRPSHRGC